MVKNCHAKTLVQSRDNRFLGCSQKLGNCVSFRAATWQSWLTCLTYGQGLILPTKNTEKFYELHTDFDSQAKASQGTGQHKYD